jgi:hypothetical protein
MLLLCCCVLVVCSSYVRRMFVVCSSYVRRMFVVCLLRVGFANNLKGLRRAPHRTRLSGGGGVPVCESVVVQSEESVCVVLRRAGLRVRVRIERVETQGRCLVRGRCFARAEGAGDEINIHVRGYSSMR